MIPSSTDKSSAGMNISPDRLDRDKKTIPIQSVEDPTPIREKHKVTFGSAIKAPIQSALKILGFRTKEEEKELLKNEIKDFYNAGKLNIRDLRTRSNEAIKANAISWELVEELETKVLQAYGEVLQKIDSPALNYEDSVNLIKETKNRWDTILKNIKY